MRNYGYPPGWLKEAEVKESGEIGTQIDRLQSDPEHLPFSDLRETPDCLEGGATKK